MAYVIFISLKIKIFHESRATQLVATLSGQLSTIPLRYDPYFDDFDGEIFGRCQRFVGECLARVRPAVVQIFVQPETMHASVNNNKAALNNFVSEGYHFSHSLVF